MNNKLKSTLLFFSILIALVCSYLLHIFPYVTKYYVNKENVSNE